MGFRAELIAPSPSPLREAVQGTSLAMKRLPRRGWKVVHLSSYALWVLVAFHMALAGTDATNAAIRVVNVIVIGATISAVGYRSLQARLPKKEGRKRVPDGARSATRSAAEADAGG